MRSSRSSSRFLIGLVAASLLGSACQGSNKAVPSTTPPAARSAQPQATLRVADPSGDAYTQLPAGVGYMDALSADVTKYGSSFDFAFTLSTAVPRSFEVPTPWDGVGWAFCVDTDTSTTPSGYPFYEFTDAPCEFIVDEVSQGGKVVGTLIDRRPLLHGLEVVMTPIPVTVRGPQVLASVPARRLGDPAQFTWFMATTLLTFPLGNDDFQNADYVPDSNMADPAHWRSGQTTLEVT